MANPTRTEMLQRVEDLIGSDVSDDIERTHLDLPETFGRARKNEKVSNGYILPGFERLSEAVGGFPKNGFTVICGPTGAGKSTLIANLWVAVNALNKNTFTVPIEIGPMDFMDMIFSIVSGKHRRTLTRADYEEGKTKWFPNFFSNAGHLISRHESRLDHKNLLAEILYAHMTRNVEVAFVDNWNFMIDPGIDSMAKSDQALHDCIVFSKKVPVHIFMVMHPKKPEKGNDDRVESIYDIKGSSTSVQEATNVLLFNRVKEKDKEAMKPMMMASSHREIKIMKARYNGRAYGSRVIYTIDERSELYSEYKII